MLRFCPVSPYDANRIYVAMMNYVLFNKSHVKKEAVQFAKFITGHYAQIEFCKNASIVPSTKISLETDLYFTKSTDKMVQVQLLGAKSMKYGDNLLVSKIPKNWDRISNVMRDNFIAAIRGERTVKEALKVAEERVNQLLILNK